MATVAVPTLGSTTWLTDIPQILLYQFRQYMMTPRSCSDVYYNQIISFTDDVSKLSYDKDSLAKLVEDSLMTMYKRIFKDTDIVPQVTCSVETLRGSDYQISITVLASDGTTTWSLSPTVTSTNGRLVMENDYISTIKV